MIYYWDGGKPSETFYLLYAYRKSDQEDLTAQQLGVLCRLVREELGFEKKKEFEGLVASIFGRPGGFEAGRSKPSRVTEVAAVDVKAVRAAAGEVAGGIRPHDRGERRNTAGLGSRGGGVRRGQHGTLEGGGREPRSGGSRAPGIRTG